jgi:hypothetical protein
MAKTQRVSAGLEDIPRHLAARTQEALATSRIVNIVGPQAIR